MSSHDDDFLIDCAKFVGWCGLYAVSAACSVYIGTAVLRWCGVTP